MLFFHSNSHTRCCVVPPLKKPNCLSCKIKVAKNAIKAPSVSYLIVAENHHGKHIGNGTWFPTLFPTLSPWSQAKLTTPNHGISVVSAACKGAWTASKTISQDWLHLMVAPQKEEREGEKKRLEMVIHLSATATTRTRDLPSQEGKVQSLQDLTWLLLQQRRCPVELKTTWHYD